MSLLRVDLKKIKKLREERKIPQREMAQKLGYLDKESNPDAH